MEFIIVNRVVNQFVFYDGYYDWPEKLNNKNSRPFKRNFDQFEYEKFQIYWSLYTYVGPAPEHRMLFSKGYKMEKNFVTSEVSIKSVSDYLQKAQVIGNEYFPEEGDQLTIWKDYYYKEIADLKRSSLERNIISLIYRQGIWIGDSYDYGFDETKFLLNGILKY